MIALERDIILQIDRERWLFGYLPVKKYQSKVTIYALQVKQNQPEEDNCTRFDILIEEVPDV